MLQHECNMLGLGLRKRKCVSVWLGDPREIYGRRECSGKVSGRRCESGTGKDGGRDRNSSNGDVKQSDPRESGVDAEVRLGARVAQADLLLAKDSERGLRGKSTVTMEYCWKNRAMPTSFKN